MSTYLLFDGIDRARWNRIRSAISLYFTIEADAGSGNIFGVDFGWKYAEAEKTLRIEMSSGAWTDLVTELIQGS